MQLPDGVKRLIEERVETVGFAAVKRAAGAMSESYRAGHPTAGTRADSIAAYLVTRMPATYAAAHRVLAEVRERLGPVASVLDVGAGSGAASLAARAHFSEAAITMVERDAGLAGAARAWLPEAELVSADARDPLPARDLVVASYAYGEFGGGIERLWEAARKALVVIEPGTPGGFAAVREARGALLALGARMIAPCPGDVPCPMREPDWCHFAARVERSSLHRRIKGGDLGYEDEKFCYAALARENAHPASARVLRRPRHQPGLVVLETCTASGLETRRVTKRDRDAFRAAREAGWGSGL